MDVFDMISILRLRMPDKKYLDYQWGRLLLEADIQVYNALGGQSHPEYGATSIAYVEVQIDSTSNFVNLLHDYGRILTEKIMVWYTGYSENWASIPIYDEGFTVPDGLDHSDYIYGVKSGNKLYFPNIAYMISSTGATSVMIRVPYEVQYKRFSFIDNIEVGVEAADLKWTAPDGSIYAYWKVYHPTDFVFSGDDLRGAKLRVMDAADSATEYDVLFASLTTAKFVVSNAKIVLVNNPNFELMTSTYGKQHYHAYITKIAVSESYKQAMVEWIHARYGKDELALRSYNQCLRQDRYSGRGNIISTRRPLWNFV